MVKMLIEDSPDGGKGGKAEMEDVMSQEERKIRLSHLARAEFTRQFHANDAINAIDTLNKMDNLYKQTVSIEREVIHTFVFKLPDGTRFTPGLLPEKTLSQESVITDITPIVK